MKFITILITFILATTFAIADERIDRINVANLYDISAWKTDEGDVYLRYSGVFKENSFGLLTTMIDNYPEARHIELNSKGGNMIEAIASSGLFRERQLKVVIKAGEICASACAYLALSSPDIEINGIMAFHLPYNVSFPMDMTLYDVSHSMVERTLRDTRLLYKNGFKAVLYLRITEHSDLDTWFVFARSEDLNKFRFNDPSEFMDPEEDGAIAMTVESKDLPGLVAKTTRRLNIEELTGD